MFHGTDRRPQLGICFDSLGVWCCRLTEGQFLCLLGDSLCESGSADAHRWHAVRPAVLKFDLHDAVLRLVR